MNDTHGEAGEGWYGFDLDGTLAVYDQWRGIDHIGEPIKPMVDLIKRLHDEGKKVKIVTARVAPQPIGSHCGECGCAHTEESSKYVNGVEQRYASDFIKNWCQEHLGFIPEITHEKDRQMLELYDDRVKQVIPNKGVLVEDRAQKYGELLGEIWADAREEYQKVRSGGFTSARWFQDLCAKIVKVQFEE